MSTKIYTEAEGDIFTRLLWVAAQQEAPEFMFALLVKITERVEITKEGMHLIFTKEFQDIQGDNND